MGESSIAFLCLCSAGLCAPWGGIGAGGGEWKGNLVRNLGFPLRMGMQLRPACGWEPWCSRDLGVQHPSLTRVGPVGAHVGSFLPLSLREVRAQRAAPHGDGEEAVLGEVLTELILHRCPWGENASEGLGCCRCGAWRRQRGHGAVTHVGAHGAELVMRVEEILHWPDRDPGASSCNGTVLLALAAAYLCRVRTVCCGCCYLDAKLISTTALCNPTAG